MKNLNDYIQESIINEAISEFRLVWNTSQYTQALQKEWLMNYFNTPYDKFFTEFFKAAGIKEVYDPKYRVVATVDWRINRNIYINIKPADNSDQTSSRTLIQIPLDTPVGKSSWSADDMRPSYDGISVTYGPTPQDSKTKQIEKNITDFIKVIIGKSNADKLKQLAKKSGVKLKGKTSVEVIYHHGKNEEVLTWDGTIDEIFTTYCNANDTLKYINDSWYRFKSKDVEQLYQEYVYQHGGSNWYRSNAAKRGVTID